MDKYIIVHNVCERMFAKSDYSVIVTTSQLELPGPQIIYANPQFTKNTGYTEAEVLGKTPRIMQGDRTERAVLDELKECLKSGHTFNGFTINYSKAGDELFLTWTVISMVINEELFYVGIQKFVDKDIVENWLYIHSRGS